MIFSFLVSLILIVANQLLVKPEPQKFTFISSTPLVSSPSSEIAATIGIPASIIAEISSGTPSAEAIPPEKSVLGVAATEEAKPKTIAPETSKPEPPIKITLTPPSSQTLDDFFRKYSEQYHVDQSLLRKIAVCESGYNVSAKNGQYGGMFQYSASTWISTRQEMGENPDPELRFNGEEAIKTTAFKISHNGMDAWKNCK